MKLWEYVNKNKALLISFLISLWYIIVFTTIERMNNTVAYFSLGNLMIFLVLFATILLLFFLYDYKKNIIKYDNDKKLLLVFFLYEVIIFSSLILSFIMSNFLITILALILVALVFIYTKFIDKNKYLIILLILGMYTVIALMHIISMTNDIRLFANGYLMVLNIVTYIIIIILSFKIYSK